MVANKKRAMKSIYLQNFEKYQDVLEYRDDASYSIQSKNDIVVEETNGVYVYKDGKVIGIYSSIDGPVIIINDYRYIVRTDRLQFEIEELSMNERKFTITKNGVTIFELQYPKIQFVDFDPWSSEDDVDFFCWIVKMSKKNNFISEYSL
ncbi:MAG: hypothetical protein GY699_02985 [Desulfobacteraceae bacterium]|nr:hypothetical protein [Desulfobacteraceae bacterium]